MTAKKYTLTDEHRAQLEPWRDQWIANAMSTEPMTDADRDACRAAVIGMYQSAKLPPPEHIVFVPSPFVLRFAGGFAAAIWHERSGATLDATDAATSAATRAATDAATSAATRAATRAATHAATSAATSAATDLDAYYSCDLRQIRAWAKSKLWWSFAQRSWNMWQGGNQWSSWDSFLSFFKEVVGLKLPQYDAYQHCLTLARRSGPRIAHPKFCMISDRPERLCVDDRNRPHSSDGPFCRWRDGSCIWAWHGVFVPGYIIERPQDITVEKIDAETNAEIRRVMIERFGEGRYIAESGLTPVQRDDFGELFVRERGDEREVWVRVVDVVRNDDGSEKVHYLAVHPDLCPLLSEDGDLGEPQEMTARNAVASTFGLRGEEYMPVGQS